MKCIFKYNREEAGRKIYQCEKCGYDTKFENAERICEPIIQTQYGEPSLAKKIGNFSFAYAKHLYKGMPTVNQEQLDERLKICKECPLFKKKEAMVGGICTHESCGCTITDEITFLNKIAWADQECPLKKWLQISQKPEK